MSDEISPAAHLVRLAFLVEHTVGEDEERPYRLIAPRWVWADGHEQLMETLGDRVGAPADIEVLDHADLFGAMVWGLQQEQRMYTVTNYTMYSLANVSASPPGRCRAVVSPAPRLRHDWGVADLEAPPAYALAGLLPGHRQ